MEILIYSVIFISICFLYGYPMYCIIFKRKQISLAEKMGLIFSLGIFIIILISLILTSPVIFVVLLKKSILSILSASFLFAVMLSIYKDYKYSNNYSISKNIFARLINKGNLIVIIPVLLVLLPHMDLGIYTPPPSNVIWYYHYLTKQIVNFGKIPNSLYVYGLLRDYDLTYISYNLFNSFFYCMLPTDIIFLKSMRLTLVFLAAFYWILIMKNFVNSNFFISIGLLLLFSTKFISYKFSTPRTEAFSIVMALISIWLIIFYSKINIRRVLFVSSVFLGFSFTSNPITALICFIFIICYILCNKSPREATDVSTYLVIFAIVVVLFIYILSGASLLTLSFIKGITKNSIDSINVVYSNPVQVLPLNSDLTWAFLQLIADKSTEPTLRDYFPGYLYRELFYKLNFIFLVGPVFLSYLITRSIYRKNKDILNLSKISLVLLLFCFLIGLFFYFFYDSYVPQRVGFRRALPYIYLSYAISLAILIYIIYMRFRKNKLIKILLIFLLIGNLVMSISLNTQYFEKTKISSDGLEALLWLKYHTPHNSRILTNEWPSGTCMGVSERTCIIDGDAPYLHPKVLTHVINLLIKTKEFYLNPSRNLDLIERYNISYIVVSKNRALMGYDLLDKPNPQLGYELEKIGFKRVFVSRGGKVEIYSRHFRK